jgi:hypothetical protein
MAKPPSIRRGRDDLSEPEAKEDRQVFDRTHQRFTVLTIFFGSGGYRYNIVDTENTTTICPGCGLLLPRNHARSPERFNASGECWQLFSDLSCYTLSKQDAEFIYQCAVDTYEAQHAGGTSRNITVAFGLIGLYLALEKGYTGKQVQEAHKRIARLRKDWPRLEPPARPAAITVLDVLRVPDGPEKMR